MTEQELGQKLEHFRKNLRVFDGIIDKDFRTGEGKLNPRQAELVQNLIDLFRGLNWQISLNSYKQLKYDDTGPVKKNFRGASPVKVRPCKEEYGDKTYFGVILVDIALSIEHRIDEQGNLVASHSMYNPAIFVPELGEIIFGCESWWGEIEGPEELDKLITDETIKNVWYVKLLVEMSKPPKEAKDGNH